MKVYLETISRIAFSVWKFALGKILTINNLRKRHIVVLEWCGMCKQYEEKIDHFMMHCKLARSLWAEIFNTFGFEWVIPHV